MSSKRFHVASHPYLLIQNQVKKQDHGSLSARSGCTTLNLYCLQQRLPFPLSFASLSFPSLYNPFSFPLPILSLFFRIVVTVLSSPSLLSSLSPPPSPPFPVRGSFSRSFYLSFHPHPLRPF